MEMKQHELEWKEIGKAEGKAEGLAEGKAEGLVQGKAEGLAEGKAEERRRGMMNLYTAGLEMTGSAENAAYTTP